MAKKSTTTPNTFIDDKRFGELIEALKAIPENDDEEARDKAISEVLIDVGGIAPESYRSFYG